MELSKVSGIKSNENFWSFLVKTDTESSSSVPSESVMDTTASGAQSSEIPPIENLNLGGDKDEEASNSSLQVCGGKSKRDNPTSIPEEPEEEEEEGEGSAAESLKKDNYDGDAEDSDDSSDVEFDFKDFQTALRVQQKEEELAFLEANVFEDDPMLMPTPNIHKMKEEFEKVYGPLKCVEPMERDPILADFKMKREGAIDLANLKLASLRKLALAEGKEKARKILAKLREEIDALKRTLRKGSLDEEILLEYYLNNSHADKFHFPRPEEHLVKTFPALRILEEIKNFPMGVELKAFQDHILANKESGIEKVEPCIVYQYLKSVAIFVYIPGMGETDEKITILYPASRRHEIKEDGSTTMTALNETFKQIIEAVKKNGGKLPFADLDEKTFERGLWGFFTKKEFIEYCNNNCKRVGDYKVRVEKGEDGEDVILHYE